MTKRAQTPSNFAFIDGQNLHLGTLEKNWKVDYSKFRTYLKDKYHITKAYYFLGFVTEANQDLYTALQEAGFIVVFREHSAQMTGNKKGNVDTDIVFEVMRSISEEKFDLIVLVSGDGDYKKLIDYLIKQQRLLKILFPNQKYASSLYKQLGSEYFDYLDKSPIKKKIRLTKQ